MGFKCAAGSRSRRVLSSVLAIKVADLRVPVVWKCRAFYVHVSSEQVRDRNESRKLGQKRESSHAAFYCRQLGIIRHYYRISFCGKKI